jgi:DNA-binding SARP family transcriptional activator
MAARPEGRLGDMLTLRLRGPVRLTDPDGADFTPHHSKALGLLALLGVAPELRRPRPWVQDKLWSGSDPEKGSANLRQTLTGLRTRLGPWRAALTTDAGWVGLDRALVRVDLTPPAEARGARDGSPEFAHGLDVRDPEFEDWLRDQRMRFEAEPPDPAPAATAAAAPRRAIPDPVILFGVRAGCEPALLAFAELVAAEAATMTAGLAGIVAAPAGAEDGARALLRLEVAMAGCPGGYVAQASWRDPDNGALRATLRRSCKADASPVAPGADIETLIAETAFVGASELSLDSAETGDAHALIYRALGALSTVEPERTAASERLFARAWSERASAVTGAWRAHIRVAMLIERTAPDPAATAAEAIEFAARAFSAAPHHPVVIAAAAEVALNVENRPHKAAELATRAVARNPANPFARRVLALALAATGEVARADEEAALALRLAEGCPNRASWHLVRGIAALRAGRFDEAERHVQTAHELAPAMKPPLRFLAPLRLRRGDEAGAAEALQALRALEPDFTLALLASEDYPAASLRATPLIAVTRSGLL